MKLGTIDINKAYLGNTKVSKMFLGTEQVFGPKEVLVLNENVSLSQYAEAQKKVGIYKLQCVRGDLIPPILLSTDWTDALRTAWKTKVSSDLNAEVRIYVHSIPSENRSRINCFAGCTVATPASKGTARLVYVSPVWKLDAGTDNIEVSATVPFEMYIRGYYNENTSLTSGSGVQLCYQTVGDESSEVVSVERQTLMNQLVGSGVQLAIGVDGVNGGTKIDSNAYYYIDLTKSYIKLNGEKTYFATVTIQ